MNHSLWSAIFGFVIFGIDILAIILGFRFYLYKKNLNEKSGLAVPLAAALIKFAALAFGVWYAVLHLNASILYFCLGAALVLVICALAAIRATK